jgi:hypothetical protein
MAGMDEFQSRAAHGSRRPGNPRERVFDRGRPCRVQIFRGGRTVGLDVRDKV